MPTGVEEAGLVIATFPLLVCLIDDYHQGLDVISRWLKYKKTLKSLRRVLGGEQEMFQNACFNLFDAVFKDNGLTARKLIADPLAPFWEQPELEEKFKYKLGEKGWQIYEGIISEIQCILGELLTELAKHIPVNQSSSLYRRVSARLSFTFRPKEAALDKLHRLIDIFQNLIKNRRTEIDLSSSDLTKFRSFRNTAVGLSEAINLSLKCSCVAQHVANLRLGSQAEALRLLGDSGNGGSEDVLEVIFQFGSSEWRATAIKLQSSNGQCSYIENLCVRLQDLGATLQLHPEPCLGFVSRCTPNTDVCYCIEPVPYSEGRRQVISLHDLLSAQQRHSGFPLCFHERDRLKLAIILATSLLGLHSSPWMRDMWTSRDILFRPYLGDLDDEAILRPYISHSFPNSQQAPPCIAPPPMVRNAALYALGKVLIQLIENRPLIDGSDQDTTSIDPEQKHAVELEPTIYRKAGKTWAEVIRRCLYCEFDMGTTDSILDNDEFLCRVYGLVIQPLAKALEYMGEPI
ncbi:hypothetical protein FGG08_006863 [Glutinoglossum americanum]|uniref:DUF7580 domain-containing protein n=1 Tax=Glutinoglossum americanum TaxID=1670608 RepID=A0A9P8KUI9_9PEZI|nr:hypothetical protein FGG08_006863 [Glutinoglossum americanum]